MDILKSIGEILNPANVESLKARIGNYAQALIAVIAVVYTVCGGLGIDLPGVGCPPCPPDIVP